MSKRLLRIPKVEALKKIERQQAKGKALYEQGKEILNAREGAGETPRQRDIFETTYKQWVDFTDEILKEVFVHGVYSFDFERTESSVQQYVSTNWVPNIEYYLTRQLIPKLDFLRVLHTNFDNFEEPVIISKSILKDVKTNSNVSKPSSKEIGDLDKLTILDILKQLKPGQARAILGIIIILIIGIFTFGNIVQSWKMDKEKNDLANEKELLLLKVKILQHQRDSLMVLQDTTLSRK